MEFNILKTSEYCENITDGTHDSPKKKEFGKKLITSKHINGDYIDLDSAYYISEEDYNIINKKSLVEINDILFSMIGTIGLIHRVVEKPNYAIKNMGLFKLKDPLKSAWLYYYLKTPLMKEKINKLSSGSTQQYITLKNLRNLEIKVPKNIEDTKKIIKILNMLDQKILINKKNIDFLTDINKEIYKNMNFRKDNDKVIKIKLVDELKIINGYSYKGTDLAENSNIGMMTIKNFHRNGGFKIDGFKSVISEKIKDRHFLEMFDIVVACTDLTQNAEIIGNPLILLDKGKYQKNIMSMDLVKIEPIGKLNKFFLFEVLNSQLFKNFALGYTSGTTVLHLNKKCFEDFEFLIPKDEVELGKITNLFEMNHKKISNNLIENRILEDLRDMLLPKLINGEINLDKIEI